MYIFEKHKTLNKHNMSNITVNEETRDKLKSLASFYEEEDEKDKSEREKKKEKEYLYNSSPTIDKIIILYSECLENAKRKDIELSIDNDNNNGIMVTYVTDLYCPDTSKLDVPNLYLNLLILKTLQEFGIINYYFDTDVSKVDKSEFDTNHKFWADFLLKNDGLTQDDKFVDILERSYKHMFFGAFFSTVAQNADEIAYNESNHKLRSVMSFLDDETNEDVSLHAYFVDWVNQKTKEGSVIFVTPDITKHLQLQKPFYETDEEKEETRLLDLDPTTKNRKKVKFLGESYNRSFYELNIESIGTALKGFKQGAFFLNGGDYIINPTKPLVYFNKIENPYIKNPILMLFNNLDFKFGKNNSVFARIHDLED